ncbi:DUF7311 family protein [Haloarcula salinisoli]|uniref:DUF7311 domain-containing protein n=1 Tax=Haloarcula salinisoli TaxID=2487746 RepID=A0A8J8CAC6_9EURY|nr:hypothetical protein [Halomicroarcula salinisoli]MBX0285591.1 hypothetical protein [Halomicroarcula salinisoli]MBX0302923.1 hypothetical protein [Halomicroarcula salinisoli]
MPVRYVVAVVLTVAITGMLFAGIDHVDGQNSRNEMETEVSALDSAAVSLMEDEELPPPGQAGPKRFVTLTFPDGSLGYEAVTHFEITRVNEGNSRIEYQLESGGTHQRFVSAPIVDTDGDSQFELDSTGDGVEVVLTLEPDSNGDPVVYIQIA